MILQPFTVTSVGKRWRFVDSNAISSDADRIQVQQISLAAVALMQKDAQCVALGISEVGIVANLHFGVYDPDGVLKGIFFIAALDYRSGPWADLIDWEVTSNDPAVFHARPMPGFPTLSLQDSLDVSVDAAHHLLSRRLTTVDEIEIGFERFSWAIYKDRDDANSRAMKRIHDHTKADPRFSMTETPDPSDAARTRVDIELS